ncbi:hypothetical protein M3Y95_00900000 [Aphelenchoides besseyi]|nr:hypothetical protein M3Y95_00900000 [Aphelenchoides besseyi]
MWWFVLLVLLPFSIAGDIVDLSKDNQHSDVVKFNKSGANILLKHKLREFYVEVPPDDGKLPIVIDLTNPMNCTYQFDLIVGSCHLWFLAFESYGTLKKQIGLYQPKRVLLTEGEKLAATIENGGLIVDGQKHADCSLNVVANVKEVPLSPLHIKGVKFCDESPGTLLFPLINKIYAKNTTNTTVPEISTLGVFVGYVAPFLWGGLTAGGSFLVLLVLCFIGCWLILCCRRCCRRKKSTQNEPDESVKNTQSTKKTTVSTAKGKQATSKI